MLDTRVTVNGVKGYVAIDHQDGTFTVCMDDNTTYFAITEELQPEVKEDYLYTGQLDQKSTYRKFLTSVYGGKIVKNAQKIASVVYTKEKSGSNVRFTLYTCEGHFIHAFTLYAVGKIDNKKVKQIQLNIKYFAMKYDCTQISKYDKKLFIKSVNEIFN